MNLGGSPPGSGTCECQGGESQHAILYSLLSRSQGPSPHAHCLCARHRTVCLRAPQHTCLAAAEVLAKTVAFLQNLPSFGSLHPADQRLLLDNCWAPLFLLGLAQDVVAIEVIEMPAPSMLKKILLEERSPEPQRLQPTLAGVHRLQCCLRTFWSLDLSTKEYAYLKGAILFNPDTLGLQNASYINSLHQEAAKALQESLALHHPEDQDYFYRILLVASTLKSIPPALLSSLFFHPMFGDADITSLIVNMLFLTNRGGAAPPHFQMHSGPRGTSLRLTKGELQYRDSVGACQRAGSEFSASMDGVWTASGQGLPHYSRP